MALSDVPVSLIDRCREGDSSAFDELFALINEDLFRWSYSMVRNEDDALEITQECFIRIFRHLHRLQDSRKFAQWAGRLLINQTNTYRVKKKKHQTDELEEGLDIGDDALPMQGTPGANPRKAAEQGEIFAKVNEAIQELPPRQRTAVLLFDVRGRSIKEIAAELDCSEGAVKFNIFQGRRKLRTLLDTYVTDDGKLTFTE